MHPLAIIARDFRPRRRFGRDIRRRRSRFCLRAVRDHAMTRFDYEQARFNMIEQQIRPWDVLDPRVLDLLSAVKREDFVPAAYRTLAFADLELPLPNGTRMWTPKMEARVIQELMVQSSARVLQIGTGSG